MSTEREFPKEQRCPKCGRTLPLRLSHLHIGNNYYDHVWRYRISNCPICKKLPCMVEGCEQPATMVRKHILTVGTGRKTLSGVDISEVRNDLWLCNEHIAIVARGEKSIRKKTLPYYVLMVVAIIAALVLGYLLLKGFIDLCSAPAIIITAIDVVLISFLIHFSQGARQEASEDFTSQHGLKKKEDYVVIGDYRDEGFLASDTLSKTVNNSITDN